MTKRSVPIVDYGMGNIRSIVNALREVGADGELISDPASVAKAGRLILPGVGAFGEAMKNLRHAGLDEALSETRRRGAWVLGICLGMQLMFEESDEGGVHQGLGWFPGRVIRFQNINGLRVPHMGWNELRFRRDHPLTREVVDGSDVYFLHSYHCNCADGEDVLASSDYGIEFCAIAARENLLGIQFHPEKSQRAGLAMLKNFVDL